MEKMISTDWGFFNESSFDVTEGVDEKSECETFHVDDNIKVCQMLIAVKSVHNMSLRRSSSISSCI